MPVSAILLAALAPITGALFGASYGTSIRIGYEIIFPALFADKKPPKDAKEVIRTLHQMFTLTGGVAAMEFGIDQGIAMAKKKTESPEVLDLINLALGISDTQISLHQAVFKAAAEIIFGITGIKQDTTTKEDWDRMNTNILNRTDDFFTRNFTSAEMQTILDDYKKRNPNPKAVIIKIMQDAILEKSREEHQQEQDKDIIPPETFENPNPKETEEFNQWMNGFTALFQKYKLNLAQITKIKKLLRPSPTHTIFLKNLIQARNVAKDTLKKMQNYASIGRNSLNPRIKSEATNLYNGIKNQVVP